MALANLRDWIGGRQYDAYGTSINSSTVADWLPYDRLNPDSRVFLEYWQASADPEGVFPPFRSFDQKLRQAFFCLTLDSQVELAIVFSHPIHEWTHHSDFIRTPFGVSYHASRVQEIVLHQRGLRDYLADPVFGGRALLSISIEEYLALRRSNAPTGLWLNEVLPHTHLVSFTASLNCFQATPVGSSEETYIGGYKVELFLLQGAVPIVMVNGVELRTLSLLEARAVCHQMLYIIDLLGASPESRSVIVAAWSTIYSKASPDYRILLNLIASVLFEGDEPTADFIATRRVEEFQAFLRAVNSLAWYCLHNAGPFARDDRPLERSPVTRLACAVRLLFSGMRRSRREPRSSVNWLRRADRYLSKRTGELDPMVDTISRSLERIEDLEPLIDAVPCTKFRTHARWVARVQSVAMKERLRSPFFDRIGFANSGDVREEMAFTPRDNPEPDDYLLGMARGTPLFGRCVVSCGRLRRLVAETSNRGPIFEDHLTGCLALNAGFE